MTPTDAVIEWITRPAVAQATTRTGTGGWVASTYRGGSGHQAKADSIRVIREKIQGRCALVAVEYVDLDGHPWSFVHGAIQQDDGTWKCSGGAGGGGGDRINPNRPLPWANLGGWGSKDFFCAGGRVHGDGIAGVRLIAPDGQSVEDRVDHGIALLIGTTAFGEQYTVELLDRSGHVTGTHFWGMPPAPGSVR